MIEEKDQIEPVVLGQLQKAFLDFQVRSEKLGAAYEKMQQEFKRINLELDRKNRELEESLVKQEETQTYLNSILESMNNGVVAVDTEGIVTMFNSTAAEVTGYDSESVLGKKYDMVFGEHLLAGQGVLTVLATGKGHTREEKVLWNKSGNPVSVSSQSALLKDSFGRRLGAVEIFNDLSGIKTLEREMQQARTMAALGEMAATVAHEIRNPLGAMGVWAGLLDRDLNRDDPRRETLSKITDALAQLNRIVSNLLVYCRPVNAQMRKINIQEVLAETINFIDIEAERLDRKMQIRRLWDEHNAMHVLADPEKIQQMVMNVCLNAIQAMAEGGILSINCCRPKKKNSSYISISIEDTGVGIRKEDMDKIWDPFYTTKENGTGLGLAIVKKYVEYHNGHIQVKSKLNEGTVVQIFLPQFQEE